MKNTVFHERMDTPTTSGKVAHKIGSYAGFLHDIGILETEQPFILTIFTNGQTDAGIPFIASVTDQLWNIQSNDYPKNKAMIMELSTITALFFMWHCCPYF